MTSSKNNKIYVYQEYIYIYSTLQQLLPSTYSLLNLYIYGFICRISIGMAWKLSQNDFKKNSHYTFFIRHYIIFYFILFYFILYYFIILPVRYITTVFKRIGRHVGSTVQQIRKNTQNLPVYYNSLKDNRSERTAILLYIRKNTKKSKTPFSPLRTKQHIEDHSSTVCLVVYLLILLIPYFRTKQSRIGYCFTKVYIYL